MKRRIKRFFYRLRRRIREDKKSFRKILLTVIALILSVAAFFGLKYVYNKRVQRTVAEADYTPEADNDFIRRDGVTYKRDGSVKSYLFLGVDDVGRSYENYGRGGRTDTILLLILDGGDLRILEISRDTMTEVDTYDTKGNYLSSGVMQINMQYSFGESPRRSAYLTKNTVSELLGGVYIAGAMALDMSGIEPIVEALGGIDVKMEEDCTYIDARYTLGAQIHMNGDEAGYFIRWRDKSEAGSNDDRMSRHTWFIRQMLTQGEKKTLSEFLDAADEYLNTDMTGDEIKSLYDSELVETVRLPGETRRGEIHDEFYVDEEQLLDTVLRLFYTVSD